MKISNHIFFFLIIFVFTFKSKSQTHYFLQYDKNFSPKVGAENLLTLHKIFYQTENHYLPPTITTEENFTGKICNISYRLSKTILLDNIIDHFLVLTQHEVFGHGSRFREFGYTENSFTLSLFPPFGDGHGVVYAGKNENERNISLDEEIAISIGGMEANDIFATTLVNKWMNKGTIHYRETILYLFSANDITHYILATKIFNRNEEGNDIRSYISDQKSKGNDIELENLTQQIFLQSINPFQWYSFYTYFVTYLIEGKETLEIPTLHIGNWNYLPLLKMQLTPFGTEVSLENYFSQKNCVWNVELRKRISGKENFFGLGINVINLWTTERWKFNTSVNFWKQPSLTLGGKTLETIPQGFGVAGFFDMQYKFLHTTPVYSFLQIGYKTPGFLKGEILQKGIIARIGISFEVEK